MTLPKKILVAIDFDDASETALDYAIDLAKVLGAHITVLHAYELPVYGFPNGALITTPEMATTIMSGAQEGLAAMCKKREAKGVELTQVVCEGNVWDEVKRLADEIDAGLIVIGTHGRKGVSHALIGSIAEKIIRTTTRPVLTLHASK